jgi:flagellar hook-associated protein 1 FlgK
MGSSFGGINTALTSLYAQRRGLDVTGENIANANTEGYSRQRVRMQSIATNANPGIYSGATQVGAGVTVTGVERSRNEYMDARSRVEHSNSAYLTTQKAAYDQIESVLAEPSDTALQARLHDMWDSWNDVANNWQDPSTRSTLIERSNTVAATLNDTYGSLSNQFDANRSTTGAYVDQVNTLAKSIAEMNQKIVVATSSGVAANELRDTRDNQIMQLSELVGATAQPKDNGAINVYIGNATLVSDFTVRKVALDGPASLDGVTASDQIALTWTDTGDRAAAGGTMGAMLDTMNSVLPGIANQLDAVAAGLTKKINDAVQSGFDINGNSGIQFFDGDTAKTIKVVIDDPATVGFSRGNPLTEAKLDNGIADGLVDDAAAGRVPDQDYQVMIGQLGVAAQAAGRRSEIQDSVTDQVDTARDGESGVNLDEEMTHLLTYQRGYEAASRVLTTIDSMLDQLINRTGLVGR